jgi:hypothetical protein
MALFLSILNCLLLCVVYAEELDGTESRYTFLLYLNDDFKGGETAFPKLNKTITPKKGTFYLISLSLSLSHRFSLLT